MAADFLYLLLYLAVQKFVAIIVAAIGIEVSGQFAEE